MYLFLLKVLSICKISFIIGSQALFFTLTQLAIPVIGFSTDISTSFALFLVRSLVMGISSGQDIYMALVYHIPTFCGALAITRHFFLIRLIIPLSAVVIFISNPIGGQAWLYSTLWLIPCVITISSPNSFFLRALASTFTSHAVGSVIWLYTYHLTAQEWLTLMPITIIERCIYALGIALCMHAITFIKNYHMRLSPLSESTLC